MRKGSGGTPKPTSRRPGTVLRSIAFVLVALTGILVVLLLFLASAPGTGGAFSSDQSLGLKLLVGLLAATLVVMLIYAIWALRVAWWFVFAPILAVSFVALSLFNVPLKSRFNASEASFNSVLSDMELAGGIAKEDASKILVPSPIGMYDIHEAWAGGGSAIFIETAWASEDRAGFAYLPDGLTSKLIRTTLHAPQFTQLDGHWYRFIDHS